MTTPESDLPSAEPQARGPGVVVRPVAEATVVGLLIGFADSRYAGEYSWTDTAYLLAGLVLGIRHAGRAWPCFLPLGASLYLVHVAAITCGRRQPFVEPNLLAARDCLGQVWTAGFGVAVGSGIRMTLAAFGLFPRKGGPAVRLLPKTTRGVLAAVACIAVTLGTLRWIAYESTTVYAAGFSEWRFRSIALGMTDRQVETILGQPLLKADWSNGTKSDGTNMAWMYTTGIRDTSNYQRRWIFVEDGKVVSVINDFWYD